MAISRASVSPRGPEPGRRVQPRSIQVRQRRSARLGHPAQHRIDQPGERRQPARARQGDRGRHRRMGRRLQQQQPGRAEPQHMAHRFGRRLAQERLQHRVQRSHPAQHRSGQPMRRRAVARRQWRAARPAPPRAADADPAPRSADRTRPRASGRPSARGGTAGDLAAMQPAARQHLIGQSHRRCRSSLGSRDAGPRSHSPGSPGRGGSSPRRWRCPGLTGCEMASLASPPSPTTSCAGRDGPNIVAGEVVDVSGQHHVQPRRHEIADRRLFGGIERRCQAWHPDPAPAPRPAGE